MFRQLSESVGELLPSDRFWDANRKYRWEGMGCH